MDFKDLKFEVVKQNFEELSKNLFELVLKYFVYDGNKLPSYNKLLADFKNVLEEIKNSKKKRRLIV